MLFVFIVKWIYYLFILYKNVMDTKILFLLWARLCEDSALIVPQSKETDVDWASTFITSHLWNLGSLWTSFISSVKIFLLSFVGQDASYSWATLWVILSSYKALHSEYSSKHFFWPLLQVSPSYSTVPEFCTNLYLTFIHFVVTGLSFPLDFELWGQAWIF